MDRRRVMVGLSALGALSASRGFAATGDLRAASREAWLYGLPLIEIANTRTRALSNGTGKINQFVHARQLATPQTRNVTTPNNDTLYSTAWLDLTKGPMLLTLPATGDRYFSAAIMNMYSENDAVLGTRTTGRNGGRFILAGPGQNGSGPGVARITTPHAWLLCRTLVDGPGDLDAAHRVQDGLLLESRSPPSAFTGYPTYPGRTAPALEYFNGVARLIAANPPPPRDEGFFQQIKPLGLTAAGGFDPAPFDDAAKAEIEAGVAEARAALKAGFGGRTLDGWTYPPLSLGTFGTDYHLRAGVAMGGLAALPRAEAMYLNPVGDSGRLFTKPGPYRLHFPAGKLPPVDGFWSLTMYQVTPEGQSFLVENAARRYAIGDRTPGLKKNADGSMDIWIARADPGGDKSANWLPAPAEGPFTVTFRAYLPRQALRDANYRLPEITLG